MNKYLVDTNYLVRFFTRDLPDRYRIVNKIISDKNNEIIIPSIVLAETNYILRSHYKFNKIDIISRIKSLINQPNIKCIDIVYTAIDLYESENLSFYDTLVMSEALTYKIKLLTFDKKMNKVFKEYKLL